MQSTATSLWRNRLLLRHASPLGTLLVLAGVLAGLSLTTDHRDPWGAPLVPVSVQPAVPPFDLDEVDEAREERPLVSHRPTVEAAFAAESYRPNSTATLLFFDAARQVTLRLYRVGEGTGTWGDDILGRNDVMRGTPVGDEQRLGAIRRGSTIRLHLGNWPSALYYVELKAAGGRVGYAPFVLAPARLGKNAIAVVVPTQTWQAYNYRDDNRDGVGDTWYAGHGQTTAHLYRPFENRGVPAHYKYYDEPFLRWLVHDGIAADVISDAELNAVSGTTLAHAYQVLIFPGHHEYVTQHEYDAVVRYRDLGGDLIFLSANNFYSRITVHDGLMTRVGWYRYLGQPESALVGVQFYNNDLGEHRGPWTIRPTRAGRWIFDGTGLEPGDKIRSGGIEADEVSTASPPNVQVLAEIVSLFGDGRNAQMTYYETANGAKVFAAGAFTLACASWQPTVTRILENLLTRMLTT